jgi:hypothetical protein
MPARSQIIQQQSTAIPAPADADANGQYDLADSIRSAVAAADAAPDNGDLLEEIRSVRIGRNHAIAGFNEITAGGCTMVGQVYVGDVEKTLATARLRQGQSFWGSRTRSRESCLRLNANTPIEVLREATEQIAEELPEFDPSDYRGQRCAGGC